MKETDQLSNSINKPTSYFYKKRKIIYINEYGYKEVKGAWFKGPEPEKGVIHIDMTIPTFRVKYPFGQRRTKDILLKGFRKSIWECSICNRYYGKVYKNHVQRMHKNFHLKFDYIPAGSYMYIQCRCEDVHFACCATRKGRTPLCARLYYTSSKHAWGPAPSHGWSLDTIGIMSSAKAIYGQCQECNKNGERDGRNDRMLALLETGEDYEQYPLGEDEDGDEIEVDNSRFMDKWGWKFGGK
jgi:hypothetical protein